MSVYLKCEDGHEVAVACEERGSGWSGCRREVNHVLCDEHLKEQIEEAVDKATENEYLIWSFEHEGWWMPKHSGYTQDRTQAGTYSYKEALAITLSANIHFNSANGDPIKMPNEAMVPLEM